jgi:hypothetical protein
MRGRLSGRPGRDAGIARWAARPPVASFLRTTGILRACERLRRTPGLLVLNYHRLGELTGNQFDDAVFSATAERFRAQVTYLKRWFVMPPPHEILDSLSRGSFDDPTALVTFDDGYRDNHELAFSVLRDLEVPACFFVVTGLLDARRLPWWDCVACSGQANDCRDPPARVSRTVGIQPSDHPPGACDLADPTGLQGREAIRGSALSRPAIGANRGRRRWGTARARALDVVGRGS